LAALAVGIVAFLIWSRVIGAWPFKRPPQAG